MVCKNLLVELVMHKNPKNSVVTLCMLARHFQLLVVTMLKYLSVAVFGEYVLKITIDLAHSNSGFGSEQENSIVSTFKESVHSLHCSFVAPCIQDTSSNYLDSIGQDDRSSLCIFKTTNTVKMTITCTLMTAETTFNRIDQQQLKFIIILVLTITIILSNQTYCNFILTQVVLIYYYQWRGGSVLVCIKYKLQKNRRINFWIEYKA